MSTNNQHIKDEHQLPEDWEKIVRHSEPSFSKSKEAVWNELMDNLDEEPARTKVIALNWFKYAAAAAIMLLLSTTAFLRFYTESIVTPAGLHSSVLLPDGSEVELNAGSEISFHPYWWMFEREVNFEGEAFFEVEKGSKFRVVSARGSTEVLGTSFNINSRKGAYQVYCKTGKVNVVVFNSSLMIEPNEMAVAEKSGLNKQAVLNEAEIVGWVENRFVFNSADVNTVFEELELQFDVKIEVDRSIASQKYTGSFRRTNGVEQNLEVICSAMDFTFERRSNGTYSIKQSRP